MTQPLIRLEGVVKNYAALRPLRIESLALDPGAIVAVLGLDAAAAEVLVGLVTGASLPDAGEVALFGRSTREVADSDTWLGLLDGVGLLTDRAVLIEQFSVEQNIAMPFTLRVDPLEAGVRPRVAALADEVGLGRDVLPVRLADAPARVAARARLARALALDPTVLLAEHPSAALPRDDVVPFARDLGRIARARRLAVLVLTGDETFARALGGEVLTHEPATGALRSRSRWRRIFG
jgi:ABC-type transporter Mla maintaining outer membrane lipid asymmetry ATPase subunit MlaF